MLRSIGLTLMCFAMFSIAGGHWAVLQTIAWSQMLVTYSQDASLKVALGKTFDGEHPCGMCLDIKEGQQKEEKAPATLKVEKKVEVFVLAASAILKKPEGKDFCYHSQRSEFPVRMDAPPVPVPRAFVS
ncbi:MAG: hypothetical protein ABIP97_11985 [Chthoniobacterales bacterium]